MGQTIANTTHKSMPEGHKTHDCAASYGYKHLHRGMFERTWLVQTGAFAAFFDIKLVRVLQTIFLAAAGGVLLLSFRFPTFRPSTIPCAFTIRNPVQRHLLSLVRSLSVDFRLFQRFQLLQAAALIAREKSSSDCRVILVSKMAAFAIKWRPEVGQGTTKSCI